MPLSDVQIRSLKPRDRVYKVSDAHSLYIEVHPTGARLWRFSLGSADLERRDAGRLRFDLRGELRFEISDPRLIIRSQAVVRGSKLRPRLLVLALAFGIGARLRAALALVALRNSILHIRQFARFARDIAGKARAALLRRLGCLCLAPRRGKVHFDNPGAARSPRRCDRGIGFARRIGLLLRFRRLLGAKVADLLLEPACGRTVLAQRHD